MVLFFVYMAVLATAHGVAPPQRLFAWFVPIAILALAEAETRFTQPWSRVVREWLPLGFILVGYREIDWFSGVQVLATWQHLWIGWDRTLLDGLRFRAAIESLGPLIPSALEAIYLSLYGIPALCVGILYWNGKRGRMDRLLTTMFLGTFCAYALLPLFPTVSPRISFPGRTCRITRVFSIRSTRGC